MTFIIRSFADVAPNSEKSENGPISSTEWNIVMKFCIHIDINKI